MRSPRHPAPPSKPTGMIPILHSPGLMIPGQLGPMSRVLLCSLIIFFTFTWEWGAHGRHQMGGGALTPVARGVQGEGQVFTFTFSIWGEAGKGGRWRGKVLSM